MGPESAFVCSSIKARQRIAAAVPNHWYQEEIRMSSMDAPPVFRRIDTDKSDVFGFEIVGHFTNADVENAFGLLDAAYQGHDKIDVLLRASGYDGFDWSTLFNPDTFKGKLKAFQHIRRYALVGGPAWMGPMVGLIAPLTSIETKHFAAADEAKAWEWLGAKPADDI
jgi:uncharacterized protein YacL (UPF0231 family)